jgi:hypothetical protein
MTTIQTRAEILTALQQAHVQVSEAASRLSDAQFFEQGDPDWSAAGYLKHLILSVKPFARLLNFPAARVEKLFGTTSAGSMTSVELVAKYEARLRAGLRAEGAPAFTPASYKIPADAGDDIQGYLITTWDKTNQQLIAALPNWSEANLDTYQVPHPALGDLTLREMCIFTVFHNRLHAADIQQAGLS